MHYNHSMGSIIQNSALEPIYLSNLDHRTPFFIFSREKIVAQFKKFQSCFPGASIHYAMKANSEPEVLNILYNAGCSFEVASIYELNILKKIGVPAEKIIYGT